MSLNIYNNEDDCMNKTLVKVYIDSSYEKRIDPYFLENNLPPNYEVEGEECLSAIPVIEICELIVEGTVPFTFVDNKDLYGILEIVVRYEKALAELGITLQIPNLDEETKRVLTLCANAKIKLQQIIDKECYFNPNFKSLKPKTLADLIPNNWRNIQNDNS